MKKLFENNINTPERYDEIYGEFSRLRIDVGDEEEEAKRWEMVKEIKDGMKILELGCGNSDLLIKVKERFPNCEVCGLDFSPVIINWLKENTKGINYEVGDVVKAPYPDHYFDYVVAGELIEHAAEPKQLISEMMRLCKENGVVAVSTPFVETSWRDPYAEHLWEFDRQDMIDLFSPYGHTEIKLFMGKGRHIVASCYREKISSPNPYQVYSELRECKKMVAGILEGNDFESILEVGCQWGENLKAIKKKFPDKKIKGVDINKNIIDEAKEFVDGVEFEFGDATKLDIPDKSFDVVFTNALLCMLTEKDFDMALQEIIRIARKYIILVELYHPGQRIGYIGTSGRLVANYEQILKENELELKMRKIRYDEWDVEPWITYGYIFTITL
jgi:ubiquinone/menaquinone biosynthesis C-methylase UbiE